MFAVIAHLDRETENVISNLWKGLSERYISTYADEIPNRKPHITLADYANVDNGFIKTFEGFYKTKDRVEVAFNTLSTFINTGTLMLTPTPSTELIELHTEHHHHFKNFSNPQSMYLPNKWTPHCTIANRLTQEKLIEAFNYCTQHLNVHIQSEIIQISIIKIDYQHNRAVGVSVINEIDL